MVLNYFRTSNIAIWQKWRNNICNCTKLKELNKTDSHSSITDVGVRCPKLYKLQLYLVNNCSVCNNIHNYIVRKKIAPFYFRNNFVKPYCFDNFWHTDIEINLQQNCNKIAHLSWQLFSPHLVKWNVSQFVHNSSNVRFKSHDSYRETS